MSVSWEVFAERQLQDTSMSQKLKISHVFAGVSIKAGYRFTTAYHAFYRSLFSLYF